MLTIRKNEALAKFAKDMTRAEKVVGDLSQTFDHVFHPFMLRHMRRQFETEGRYGGAPWADYSQEPIYAAAKLAAVGHLRILRWKAGQEQLAPSLLTRGSGHVELSDRVNASFGTRVPHAAQLEQGGIGPYGERFPPRLILRLPPRDRLELVGLIQSDLLARIMLTARPTLSGV